MNPGGPVAGEWNFSTNAPLKTFKIGFLPWPMGADGSVLESQTGVPNILDRRSGHHPSSRQPLRAVTPDGSWGLLPVRACRHGMTDDTAGNPSKLQKNKRPRNVEHPQTTHLRTPRKIPTALTCENASPAEIRGGPQRIDVKSVRIFLE